MGWFDYLRARDAERKEAEARALEAARADWLTTAWEHVADRTFVERLYAAVAEDDPSLALELARAKRAANSGEAVRALREEGAERVGPWLLAQLDGDRGARFAQLLLQGIDLGRPALPHLPQKLAKQVVPMLAGSPHREDRDAAAAVLLEQTWPNRAYFAFQLAEQDDPRADPVVEEVLRAFREGALERVGFDGDAHAFGAMVRAMCARKSAPARERWVAGLAECLHQPWALFGLTHLATGEDDEATPALQAFADARIDERSETRLTRMGAHLALAARGHDLPLDDARWLRDELHPRRYSWPKHDDLVFVRRLVSECFLRAGNDDEKRWVAAFASCPYWLLREVGDEAREALGEPPLDRVYYDDARIAATDTGALLDALNDERTVFVDPIVKALAARAADDDAIRPVLTKWSRTRLENQPNHYCNYADDVPPGSLEAIRFLRRGLSDEEKAALADSPSQWIRTFVVEDGEMDHIGAAAPTAEGVRVRRFDEAPFVIGAHVNGVDVSPDGEVLCVVGSEVARLIDAKTGAPLRSLELRWSWGFDCCFHPSGERVAATFHGGHVEVYDVATGERTQELRGHGGVPHGTRCAAWSPDGDTLVTGGADGRLIAWDVAAEESRWMIQAESGSYQDVVFLRDGSLLAAHVKTSGGEKNYLERIDPKTGEAKRIPMDVSIWAIAERDDGALALGGEAKDIRIGRLVGDVFEVERTLPMPKVTRLAWDGEALFGCSEAGGFLRFDGDEIIPLAEDTGPLWAMAHREGEAWAIGTAGVLHRARGKEPVERGETVAHAKRLVGAVELESGEIVSVDWDGHVIRWPAEGGMGTAVASLSLTPESVTLVDEDTLLLGTRKGLRLLRLDGELLAHTEERADHLAISGDLVACSSDEQLVFRKLPDLEEAGIAPVTIGSDDVNSVCAVEGGFLAGTENGEVGFVKDGALVWLKADHGADRMNPGDPHNDVASVVATPTRFASAATDHVARVYSWPSGEPELRIATGFGLFNRLSFDDTGRRLAIPSDGLLEIYDVEARERVLAIGHAAFESSAIMSARFLRDGRILVLTKPGRIYVIEEEA